MNTNWGRWVNPWTREDEGHAAVYSASQDVRLVCDTLIMTVLPKVGGIDAALLKLYRHLLRTRQQLASAKK